MIERATIHMKETFFISDDVLKMGFAFFFNYFILLCLKEKHHIPLVDDDKKPKA